MAHEIALPQLVADLLSSFDHRGDYVERIDEVIAVAPLPPVIDRNPLIDLMDGRAGFNVMINKELKQNKGYKNFDDLVENHPDPEERKRLAFMKKATQRAKDQHRHLVEAMEQNNLNTLHVINLVKQVENLTARIETLEKGIQ